MNKGSIKWNINITATISGDVNDSEYNEELSQMISSIKKFNGEITDEKKPFEKNTKGIKISSKIPGETVVKLGFNTENRSPYVFNDTFQGIKNIMKWFDVIQDDRDWDYRYITNVLKFKIKNTCNYIEEKQRHLDWQRDVKYMKISLNLMDRIWSDEYSDITTYDSEYSDYHISEYNWIPNTDDEVSELEEGLEEDMKGSVRMEVKEISNTFSEFFEKNKLMHKKAIEYLKTSTGWHNKDTDMVQAMVISKLKHKKAIKLLFKIISEHIEEWWD